MVGSVLVVEDVRFTRAMTRRMIAASIQGDVHEAASGQEALDALRLVDDIDVVVADISMPGMSGLELLKTIRIGKSAAASDIPFIIISGAITDAVRSVLEKLDVTAVIAKPVRKDELVALLERIDVGSSKSAHAAEYLDVEVTARHSRNQRNGRR